MKKDPLKKKLDDVDLRLKGIQSENSSKEQKKFDVIVLLVLGIIGLIVIGICASIFS